MITARLMAGGLIGLSTLLHLLVGTAAAQDIVGKTVLDGRVAVLLSDGTWSYDAARADSVCQALSVHVDFCADQERWRPSVSTSPDVTAAFRHDTEHHGQFIVEEIGAKVGITPTFMRDVALRFAERATGNKPLVLASQPTELGGQPASTVIYAVKVNGISVVYANTILVQDALTVQAMTWQVGGTDFSDQHRALHEEFVGNTRLKD